MHQKPDHFEIALTLAAKFHGKQRIVCASPDDFMASVDVFYPIANGQEPFPLPPGMTLPMTTFDARLTLDVILPGGRKIPYALYRRTMHSSDVCKTLRWSEHQSRKTPKRLIFCPDFGGCCVRDQNGTVLLEYPIFSYRRPRNKQLDALADEIHAWQHLYEFGVHLELERNLAFDWEDFHAKGIAVCEKVQKVLGRRSQVFYRRLTELPPPNDENSLVVFLPD